MRIPSEGKLLRIFIGESDQWHGEPLHQAIVHLARREGLAGATCVKGFLGFGAKSRMHTASILRLSENLPVIVEIVDSEEKINRLLPKLEPMVAEGLITMEPVKVIMYRPGRSS